MSTSARTTTLGSLPLMKCRKSGRVIAEKIRQLSLQSNRQASQAQENIQQWECRYKVNPPPFLTILPVPNLQITIFHQPEIAFRKANGNPVYKISNYKTPTTKSVKPYKKMKPNETMNNKRSILAKIEDMLNIGKYSVPCSKPLQSKESLSEGEEIWTRPKRDVSYLSEDILENIFLYFSMKERCTILSKICKKWNRILKNPMFWTDLQFEGEKVTTAKILDLIKNSPLLISLRLNRMPNVHLILFYMCRYASGVKKLAVRDCILDTSECLRSLHRVLLCCSSIEVLDLRGTEVNLKSFYLELGLLKNLRSLNLSSNKSLRCHDLMTMSVNCRQLKELKLLHRSLERDVKKKIRDDNASFIISNLQNSLTVLKIDMRQLGTPAFQAILRCQNLTCLSLTNCLQLNGPTFRKFHQLKNLEILRITRATDIGPDDFQHLFNGKEMSNVLDLDINACWRVGELGLRAITFTLESLKSLSLKNCKSIVGRDLVNLSRCQDLASLNLAHTSVDSNQLTMLATYTKKLRNLTIDSEMCSQVPVHVLRELAPEIKIRVSLSEYLKDERDAPAIQRETKLV